MIDWEDVFSGFLIVAAFVGFIGGLLAIDNTEYTGPVNGCISYQHTNNHFLRINSHKEPITIYCKVADK